MKFDKNHQPCLTDEDLERYRWLIDAATSLWAFLVKEAADARVAQGGQRDIGSVVLGARIEVPYLGPRKRIGKPRKIISAPGGQGCGCWEGKPLQAVLGFLQEHGLPSARYNPGVMD